MIRLFHGHYGGYESNVDEKFAESETFEQSPYNVKLNNLLRERRIYIRKVVCGFRQLVFFITENASVYVLGPRVDSSGLAGVSMDYFEGDYLKEPYCIIDGKKNPIREIISTFSHTMFLARDGCVYGCGSNERFQMYTPRRERLLPCITKLSIPNQENSKFKLVSGGSDFSIYLSVDNKMYSSGVNSSGQCGIRSQKDQIMSIVDYETQLRLIDPKSDCNIIEMKSNYNSTIFRTSDCRLYGFGNKTYGCMGVSSEMDFLTSDETENICRVGSGSKEFMKEKCISYSCGSFFVCAITESNQLFVFGFNNFNQISVEDAEIPVYVPMKINLPSQDDYGKTIQIACGGFHTIALSTENKLFLTGLYHPKKDPLQKFTIMDQCNIGKDTNIQLSAGEYQSAILMKIDYISQSFPRLSSHLSKSDLSDTSFHFTR